MKTKIIIASYLIFCLGKIANSQVSLQTGSPDINLPLYSVTDAVNRLGTTVSLSYVGGNGIKVDDAGSFVGTGWDIHAGGFISREQIGEPDDQKQRTSYPEVYFFPQTQQDYNTQQTNFANYVANYYPNGYLYSEYSPADVITNAGAYSLLKPGAILAPQKYLADRQQDVFTFNMNGRVGKFMIGKDHSILFLNEKDNKLKLTPTFDETLINQNIRTTLSAFTITDENGIQYIYQDMELSEVIKYIQPVVYSSTDGTASSAPIYPALTYGVVFSPITSSSCSTSAGQPLVALKGVRTGQYTCNKWVLTKIINPVTSNTLQFTYLTEQLVTDANHVVTATTSGSQCSINITVNAISIKTKKLTSIYNQYGDKVEFVYGAIRQDLQGDYVLSKVNFYKNSVLVSDVAFSYGYFYQNTIQSFSAIYTAQQMPYLRLCLLQLQKEGLNSLKEAPYKFDYYTCINSADVGAANTSDIVPPKFTVFKDGWGYYNWASKGFGSLPIPANGGIYPAWVYNVITGTSSLYAGVPDTRQVISGLSAEVGLIKTIAYPTGGSLLYNYEPNYVYYNNTNTQVGGVRIKSTILTDNTTPNVSTETDYSYTLGTGSSSSGWGYNVPVYSTSGQTIVPSACGSGHGPSISAKSMVSNFLWDTQGLGATVSGAFDNTLWGIAAAIILQVIEGWFSSPPSSTTYASTVQFNSPVNYNNVLPLNYSQVALSNTSGGITNGKTIYYYTSSTDYPLEVAGDDPIYAMKQRYGYWKYGLVKKVEIYSNASATSPIKATQYNYSANTSNYSTSSNFLSQAWMATTNEEVCETISYTFSAATSSTSEISAESYYPFTGKLDLVSTNEYTYDPSNLTNGVLNTTSYQYNADGFISLKDEYNSKGQKIETIYKYPDDYTATGTVATMKQYNIIAPPILTEKYIYKSTTKYLLYGTITSYTQPRDISPSIVYKFAGTSSPIIDNSVIQPFNSAQVLRDATYYQPVAIFNYDASSGALIQKTARNDNTAYIVDPTDPNRLLAKVANASGTDVIAYTSFEQSSSKGWLFSGTLTADATSPTGNNCFLLGTALAQPNGAIISVNVNQSATYVVSYWTKNASSYSVTGSTNIKKGRTVMGWTYYEHTVSNVSGYITVSGNGYIDELRLYPVSTQMTSYCYDIYFKNISTECDAANRITYYEYDGLGRLSVTRNQDRYIVKTYCYNYAGQSTNCSGSVFYNTALAGYFKGPCSAGYISDNVTYLVPANTYYSFISADDANQQALTDIANNGQTYANNHPACRVPQNISITYSNSTNFYGHVKFTNLATGSIYTYDLISNKPAGTVAGTIPQGVYSVYMSSSGTGNYSYRVYDQIQSGSPTFTIPSIDFSAASITTESLSVGN